MYTNKYLLHNAEIVFELCIKSKEEFRLWSELKRLQGNLISNIDNKDIEDNSMIKGFNFEGSEIYISGNSIKFVKDGQVNEFIIDELRKSPRRVIREIIGSVTNR